MAKELMEIGGFITEGAEIVNHDNSLSGNGTVDSPLGVVPTSVQTYTAKDDVIATEAVTGMSYGVVGVSKQGNLICFSLQFDPMGKLTITKNAWNYVFTLNDPFKPANIVNGNWSTLNTTGPFYGNFKIETDGKFYIRQQTTENSFVRSLSVAYFTP
jgi:hypothetical protein